MQDLHEHKLLVMPTKRSIVIGRVALVAWLASVSASAPSQAADLPLPSEPLDPYEALSFYEGTWALLGKGNEGYRETCSWLAGGGRRHIVCRASVQTAEGPRESLGVYSYDETKGEFVYHGFGSRGTVYIERGQRIPGGFRFMSERGTGADRVRTRFTIVEAAEGRVNTVSETAKPDRSWVVEERQEYLRTRP